MKFVVDAQLPKKMAEWLRSGGCDAVHTLDLPNGNRTTDKQLIAFADSEGRIVVTKDDDFVDSHLLNGQPANRRNCCLCQRGTSATAILKCLLCR